MNISQILFQFHGVLIYSLVIIILSTNVLVVRADDDEQYEPSDDICDKCNCTNVEGTLEDGESGILFTIDCSMKSYQHLFAKWPEAMGDNHRGKNKLSPTFNLKENEEKKLMKID